VPGESNTEQDFGQIGTGAVGTGPFITKPPKPLEPQREDIKKLIVNTVVTALLDHEDDLSDGYVCYSKDPKSKLREIAEEIAEKVWKASEKVL
jgi:hypothetical protein